jgi:hypothetical protein
MWGFPKRGTSLGEERKAPLIVSRVGFKKKERKVRSPSALKVNEFYICVVVIHMFA